MKTNIGEFINEIRRSKFIGLKELSKKMNLGDEGHIYLSNIECSIIIPTKDEVINILNALGVSCDIEEILYIIEHSNTSNNIYDNVEYQEETYFKTFKRSKQI